MNARRMEIAVVEDGVIFPAWVGHGSCPVFPLGPRSHRDGLPA